MGIYKEKREHTKKILMDSFWEIYEKKSIDEITVKEITDKAGYNRATFYIHFKDVNDILQCIEDQLFETFDNIFKQIDIENCSHEVLLKMAFDMFALNSKYYSVLLSFKGDPYFVAKSKEKLKKLFYSFNKKNSTLTEENTDFIMEYIISGLISSVLYWFDAKPCSEEDFFNNLYKLIIVCTQI